MAKTVVIDIEKKDPDTISLKEGEKRVEFTETEKVLDISQKRMKSFGSKRAITDITGTKSYNKVMFFHVNEDESKLDRLGESLRVAVAGVLILFIINIVNIYQKGLILKDSLVSAAESGYSELMTAKDKAANMDFSGAETTFKEAKEYFNSAQESISFLKVNENYFFTKEKTLESVQGVLSSAKNTASAGQNFSKGIKNLEQLPQLFINENTDAGEKEGKKSLTEKLKDDLVYIDAAIEDLKAAEKDLSIVSKDVLPPTFREKLSSAKTKIAQLNEILAKTRKKIPAILELLGDRYPHRYLILLQNDTEARPTGGFIGSYIIMDINDGYLTKMDFHDVYELDGQLQEYIAPPPDIKIVSDNWRMRDSNYSPDFAISGEKAAWFLQKQGGPSVDSVIAVNQSFIEDLLRLSGPIKINSLSSELTADNFQVVLSYIIESKLTGEQTPKAVMEELLPVFQKRLLSNASVQDVLNSLIKGIKDKKILFYSRNEKVQKLFNELGMTNRVLQTGKKEDYLNVISTSIGGNKSDKYINQNIKHVTNISADGTVMDKVTITRKHTWTLKELENWKSILGEFGFNDIPPHIQYILGAGPNKAFIKLYVPKGSTLKSVEGFDMSKVLTYEDEDTQKTYFMVQMDVQAGSKKTVTLEYELPYSLSFLPADAYKFFMNSQPAINKSYLEKDVIVEPKLQIYRKYPDKFIQNDDFNVGYNGIVESDLYLSTLVGA